jgi:hypothetical protein
VSWVVEVTDQFERWWDERTEEERISIDGMIHVLEAHGPALGSPYSLGTVGSRYPNLRQLHVPHTGRTICVFYVPDEGRSTVVLLMGDTEGTAEQPCSPAMIARAESIYSGYLSRHRH